MTEAVQIADKHSPDGTGITHYERVYLDELNVPLGSVFFYALHFCGSNSVVFGLGFEARTLLHLNHQPYGMVHNLYVAERAELLAAEGLQIKPGRVTELLEASGLFGLTVAKGDECADAMLRVLHAVNWHPGRPGRRAPRRLSADEVAALVREDERRTAVETARAAEITERQALVDMIYGRESFPNTSERPLGADVVERWERVPEPAQPEDRAEA